MTDPTSEIYVEFEGSLVTREEAIEALRDMAGGDLDDEIEKLKTKIADLEAKIKTLGGSI